MSDITNAHTVPAALTGSMRDFRVPGGADLLGRTESFFKWQNLRRHNGLWPFSRATEDGPSTVCWAQDDSGNRMRGVNFASQDYLSLSSHSGIKATAKETIERCGVHSAGSPALVGNTSHSVAPDLLRSGIYLGARAERPAVARGNLIEGNAISGFKIKCIAQDPGVSLAENKVERNQCADLP